MSSKKISTPSNKKTTTSSKLSTPSNLNLTAVPRCNSNSKDFRRTPGFKNQTNLDSTVAGTSTNVGPKIKRCIVAPPTDWGLQCDFMYDDYVRSLVKKDSVHDILEKHKQDMKDQITLRKDHLYKLEGSCKTARQQTNHLEQLKIAEENIDCAQKLLLQLKEISINSDLEKMNQELKFVLELLCNRINLMNIKPITSQEDYDKLVKNIEECARSLEKIKLSGHDFDSVSELANTVKKFQELKNFTVLKLEEMVNLQKHTTFNFLKSASDMCARKGRYEEE